MTSIGMTSHCMTSCYGVYVCIECVNRPVPKTCKVPIRYVSWFTKYSTTLIIFRMTLVFKINLLYETSYQYSYAAIWKRGLKSTTSLILKKTNITACL